MNPDCEPIPGQLNRLDGGRAATFCGTKWHGTEPYIGTRSVCICYMPRNWQSLGSGDRATLESLGFILPEDPVESITKTVEACEREVSVFKAMTAEPEDILLFPGAGVTVEERRTLKQSSHNQRTQHPPPEPTPSHPSLPYADDEDDKGDEGFLEGGLRCSEGLVEGLKETERERENAVKPWSCASDSTLEPLAEEDELRKRCREGIYHPKLEACVQARGIEDPIARFLGRMFRMA